MRLKDIRLEKLIQEAFALEDDIAITESDGLGSISGWDSLGHLNLMVAIESAYGIRWTTQEIAELQTVGEIKRALAKRTEPTR